MFIKNDAVIDWKDLQNKVAQLFFELGCGVETPHVVELAGRGKKEVDVFICDKRSSLPKITLVECKWWNSEVPQDTVHSFHTVMNGCGANSGFIVSKIGFQTGAYEAADKTNITLLTFEEMQHRFGPEWFDVQESKVSKLLEPLKEAARLHFDQFNGLPIHNNMFFHTPALAHRLMLLHAWSSVLILEANSRWPETYLGAEPVKMARDPLRPFADVPVGKHWHEAPTVREFYRRLIKGLDLWNKAFERTLSAAHRSFDNLLPEQQGELMNHSLLKMWEDLPLRVLKEKVSAEEYTRLLNLVSLHP
jgi:hypothetical protein